MAHWGSYYFGKVVETDPLKLMFAHEPVGSSADVKLTGKAKTWNKKDVQPANKDYIVCCIPPDIVQPTKVGLKIPNEEKCVDYVGKEIANYEL